MKIDVITALFSSNTAAVQCKEVGKISLRLPIFLDDVPDYVYSDF